MFERFTDSARRGLVQAQAEAIAAAAESITVAHLVIGMLDDESSDAAKAAADLGFDVTRMRTHLGTRLAAAVPAGSQTRIPLSAEVKAVLPGAP